MKKFRFAVTRAGGFTSGIWVAHSRKSDFYLTPTALHGAMKISLHPAGGFRVGFTKEFLAKHGGSSASREIVVWPKPAPDGDPTHVLSLLIAGDYLKLGSPEGTPSKPLYLYELPDGPEHAEFMFFFASPGDTDLSGALAKFGFPLIHVTLENGDRVAIVVRRRLLPGNEIPWPKGLGQLKDHWGKESEIAPPGETVERSALLVGDPGAGQALLIMDLPRVSVSGRLRKP